MIIDRTTVTNAPRVESAPANTPLVLHPRGGVVIVTLLLLTLGLVLMPLIVGWWSGAPIG